MTMIKDQINVSESEPDEYSDVDEIPKFKKQFIVDEISLSNTQGIVDKIPISNTQGIVDEIPISNTQGIVDEIPISKIQSIVDECIEFINGLSDSLSYLIEFRNELQIEFKNKKDVSVYLDNVFREIEPLQMLYKLVIEKLKLLQEKEQFCLANLFLDLEIRASLVIHKSFLSQYAINAKWIGHFNRTDDCCKEACDRAIKRLKLNNPVSLESCLYTIFNSLFSFELMLDRYSKCFDENHVFREKAEEAKRVIRDVLKQSGNIQNQEKFCETLQELSLLSGRLTIPKINTEFIMKDFVVKYSEKDNREIARQLILFSDGLYVTHVPGNINTNVRVLQELSFKLMEVSVIPEDENRKGKKKWGLNIHAGVMNKDFYFDNQMKMLTWKNALEPLILLETENSFSVFFARLGEIAPDWQSNDLSSFCNGFKCSSRFTSTNRRHHCRADGLLYCDNCTPNKLSLPFTKEPESRVCELCFIILKRNSNDIANVEQARKQLEIEQARKQLEIEQARKQLEIEQAQKQLEIEQARKQLETIFQRKTRKGIKLNWLDMRVYNNDKKTFGSPDQCYCELDFSDPFLKLYKRLEDKIRYRDIILLGMNIKTNNTSKFHKKLKPNQFIIEHQDKQEAYMFKASNEDICIEWVHCLRESIKQYVENE